MRPIPKFDTECRLNEICSREDFQYKKSLRNTMAPTFVPDAGKYDVEALATSHAARRKDQKAKVQLTDLEIQMKKLRKEQALKMNIARMERLYQNQDKFARLCEKENLRNFPCVNEMAEKRLFYDTKDRNKLAELNYLLHRKQDYTPERNTSREHEHTVFKQSPELKSGFKNPRTRPFSSDKRVNSTDTKDQTVAGLPFIIGDSRTDDKIILEGTEDDHTRSKQIEVINYPKPSAYDGLSKDDLISLIEEMDKELVDLNKDLYDERKKKSDVDGKGKSVPKAFLHKMKNSLIRSLWDLGELKNEVTEKDRRLENLTETIKRFDPSLAKQAARSEVQAGSKMHQCTLETEKLLRLVEDLLEEYEKDADTELKPKMRPSTQEEFERLKEQLEAVKSENEILKEYFKKFRQYDDSIVKLNNKQLLEKGTGLSIELLLRYLDRQTTELIQKNELLSKQQEELAYLHKKVLQIEEISVSQQQAFSKETESLLNLLQVGQDAKTVSFSDPHQLIKVIRENITNLKLQNQDVMGKNQVMSQIEQVKDAEVKDLREKLILQSHHIEKVELDKAQLEERLRFSEIEKNNLEDMQFSSQEEMARRLRAESKRLTDELTEKVRMLTQKTNDQEKTIQALSGQLNNLTPSAASDKEALESVFNQFSLSTYKQDMVASFDSGFQLYLESKLGKDNLLNILAFDDFLAHFKFKVNLLESLYQEKLIRSNLILKKCSNHLKILYEYVRVCEQLDIHQPQTFQLMEQLRNLNLQKSHILNIIEEVKGTMKATLEVLSESQLAQPEEGWDLCINSTIQKNLKLIGMSDSEVILVDMPNENLFQIWMEKYIENKNLYRFVCQSDTSPKSPEEMNRKQSFEPDLRRREIADQTNKQGSVIYSSHPHSHKYPTEMDTRIGNPQTEVISAPQFGRRLEENTFKLTDGHRIIISSADRKPKEPLSDTLREDSRENRPSTRIQEKSPSNFEQNKPQESSGPSRFANCLGYTEPETSQSPSKRQIDDISAITEEIDMYEKLNQEETHPNQGQQKRHLESREGTSYTSPLNTRPQGVSDAAGKQQKDEALPRKAASVDNDLETTNLHDAQNTMMNMLYQQAKLLENKLEKKRSFES